MQPNIRAVFLIVEILFHYLGFLLKFRNNAFQKKQSTTHLNVYNACIDPRVT